MKALKEFSINIRVQRRLKAHSPKAISNQTSNLQTGPLN